MRISNKSLANTVELSFDGPWRREDAATFSDFRLDVTFRHVASGQTVTAPGYFAADGDAANSGASSGSVWRVKFAPPKAGDWTYDVSFRKGTDIAASVNPSAGTSAGFMDGEAGRFSVGQDLVANHLRADGDRYPSLADGTDFLKTGANSPENFLAYADFDATVASHRYQPHVGDWKPGDPTWSGGEGKGVIGAINYLASEGVNSLYMVTTTAGGDGRDVWPWASEVFRNTERYATGLKATEQSAARVYDVSKLEQWQIAFGHADDKGIAQQLVLFERENDHLLNDGAVGVERAIYYREMVARFGHNERVIWNVGEETRLSAAEIKQTADRLKALDPYDHMVVVHTRPDELGRYDALLGFDNVDGVSLQAGPNRGDPTEKAADLLERSAKTDNPWVVFWDERNPSMDGVLPDGAPGAAQNHAQVREELWGMLFEGVAGVEWYFGYNFAHSDLTLEDFRSRDDVWEWTVAARNFVEDHLPFDDMSPAHWRAPGDARVFADHGKTYAVYFPSAADARLDLGGTTGTFEVLWFDPIGGGPLRAGSKAQVTGGATVDLGDPPSGAAREWVALVRRPGDAPDDTPGDDPATDGGAAGRIVDATQAAAVYDAAGGAFTYVFDRASDSTRSVGDYVKGFGADDRLDLDGLGFSHVVHDVDAFNASRSALLVREVVGGSSPVTALNLRDWKSDAFQLKVNGAIEDVMASLQGGGAPIGGGSATVVASPDGGQILDAGGGAFVFVYDSRRDSPRSDDDVLTTFGADDAIDLSALDLGAIVIDGSQLAPGKLLVREVAQNKVYLNADGWAQTDLFIDVRGSLEAVLDGLIL